MMKEIKVLRLLEKAEWEEAKHKREKDGKFGSGGGSGGTESKESDRFTSSTVKKPKGAPAYPGKKGENEEDAKSNNRFTSSTIDKPKGAPKYPKLKDKPAKEDNESFEPEIVGYEDGKPVYGGAKLEARVAARQKEWEDAGRPDERLQEEKAKHSKGLSANGYELDQWHESSKRGDLHYTTLDSYGNEKKAFTGPNKKGGFDAHTIGSGLIGPKKTSHATLEEAKAAGLKRLKNAPDMEPFPQGKAETHEHWVNRVKEAKQSKEQKKEPSYAGQDENHPEFPGREGDYKDYNDYLTERKNWNKKHGQRQPGPAYNASGRPVIARKSEEVESPLTFVDWKMGN